MKREAEKINLTQEKYHSNMPEHLRKPLMKVASKLLSRDKATFEQLTPSEQKLWNSFETDQIYRLLTGEPYTVPEFRFNWYTIDTTDGYCEQPRGQPALRNSAPAPRTTARTPAPTPAPLPAPTVKAPRASTSTRARLPSSTTSLNQSSKPSTTPSSPMATSSSTVPRTKYSSSMDTAPTPRSNCSTTNTAPSRSLTPPPVQPTTPKSAKGSGRLLRLCPDVNYRDLHLGRNLLLGCQQFLKRCRSTWKTVGKAFQQTIKKVQKLADEFPVISRHSSSSSMASSK